MKFFQFTRSARNRIVTLCTSALIAFVWLRPIRELPTPGSLPSQRLSTHWGLFGWFETVTHRSGEVVCDIFFHGAGLRDSLLLSLLLAQSLAVYVRLASRTVT